MRLQDGHSSKISVEKIINSFFKFFVMNNLYKTLFPLLAIILGISFALCFSSFNKKGKSLTPVAMYYHGSTYSQSDVENKSNWNTTPVDCFTGTDKACQVSVDPSLIQSGAFIATVSLSAENSSSAALLDVKNSGISVEADIQNRD